MARDAVFMCGTLLTVLGLTSLSLPTAGQAQDGEAATPRPLLLSTASTGGAFHQGGVTLSALVKIKLLPTQQIDLATRNSSGSLENIARLRDGTSDLAIVQALLGSYAWSGTGLAANIGAQKDLRAVMMLWPNVEHFIIRKDLVTSGTIADFQALKGRRVSLGREQSAIESNRVLLGNLGLDIATDVDQALLSFRPSVEAFKRGEIDGLSLPASTPVPAFTNLMGQLGPDAVLLNWTEEQLRQADGDLGLWSPLTVPANTYPGQSEPLQTIAQPNFLAVRADVDDDVVYALTKAIFENLPFLKRLHGPFQLLDPERAVVGLPVPLHPGALRYYDEIRLDLDEFAVANSDYDLFGNDLTSPAGIKEKIGQSVVKLMTPEDGTSDLMIDDLLSLASPDGEPRILPIRGKGAAHNLADLLYLSGIDVGVLQADVLEHERTRGAYRNLPNTIRYIAKWADTEIHLLVRDEVLDIKDLRDQPVNFGPPGSGSEVTASLLFNRLRLPVRQTSYGHAQALAKLKAGEIVGMVYVAQKPVPLFRDIEVRDRLRLLGLPAGEKSEIYRAADLTNNDYPTLVFGEQTVKTLSVPQLLAAYNWPVDNERYPPIANFVDSFLQSLADLQNGPRGILWQDADPTFNFVGWQRHPSVDDHLEQRRTAGGPSGRGGPLTETDKDTNGVNGQAVEPAKSGRPTRRRPVF